METILQILEETPWWVYFVFFFVFLSGIQSLHRRTVSLHRLIILPALFTLWSFHSIYAQWEGLLQDFLYWILFLSIGSALGWLMIRKWKIHIDKERKTLSLPGTHSTLWLALAIFFVRYFFGYYYAVHDSMPRPIFLADIVLSSAIAGIFIGRSIHLWFRYEKIC